MTTTNPEATAFTLSVTEEERGQLLNWLEERRRNKLIEEHRTKTTAYREYVLQEEAILEKLISKLRRP